MSMPRRSRSRMTASVLQAGPMVQIILARRRRAVPFGVGLSAGLFAIVFNDSSNGNVCFVETQLATSCLQHSPMWQEIRYQKHLYDLGVLIAVNSFPSMARGNSSALNSAPTSTTKEIRYIHTRSAIAAPSEP